MIAFEADGKNMHRAIVRRIKAISTKNETPLKPPLKGILILYLFFKSLRRSSIESLLPPEKPPEPLLLLPDEGPHGPSSAKILNLFLFTIHYM